MDGGTMRAPRVSSAMATRRRTESGAAAVEFALVLPILLTLVFGILSYGWYFFTAQSVSSAARETARRLIVGDCQVGTEAQDFARSQAGQDTLTLTFGSVADPTTNTLPPPGEVLQVVVNADGRIFDLLPLPGDGQVQRIVKAMVEDTSPGAAC